MTAQQKCGQCAFHQIIQVGQDSNQKFEHHRCTNLKGVDPNFGLALIGRFIGEQDKKPKWCPVNAPLQVNSDVIQTLARKFVKMDWIAAEDKLPEPDIAVLAAWTNGDEYHVAPSCWDKRDQQWQDFEGQFSDEWSKFWVYAWASWPEPPVLANNSLHPTEEPLRPTECQSVEDPY